MTNGYQQFAEQFRELLLAATGLDEGKITIQNGECTEDDRMYVECARKGGVCQICGLHTKELFDLYCEGASMEEIICNSIEGLQMIQKEPMFQKVMDLGDYSAVEKELFIRLLNLENNREELQDAVYRTIGEIAMVLYLRVANMNGCITSIKIRKPILEMWDLDETQVFDRALVNTYFMSPPRMYRWERMVHNLEYRGENFMNLCEKYELRKNCMGNCLSTTVRTNGAVAIFLPGVAKRIGHLMGHNFYIVFTSIHEAMIHNADMTDLETLREVLKATVQEATPEEEFLTYQIFYYDREKDRFTFE